ncbi:armadillo-type protein, partial [Blastocladiella britannica]
MLDLPDDVHVEIGRYLDLPSVVALRSTCRALRCSELLLTFHPLLAALAAVQGNDAEMLHSAAARAPLNSLYSDVVARLLRAGELTASRADTIRDAGFPSTNPGEIAAAMAAVATYNCPAMLPRVLALAGFNHEPDNLWDADAVADFPVLRLARIYEYAQKKSPPTTLADVLAAARWKEIGTRLVDAYAPPVNHEPHAFDMVLGLENDADDEVALLKAARAFRTVLSRNGFPDHDAVLACNPLRRLVLLLRHHSIAIAEQASWALCNLAAHTAESTRLVVDHGAIPYLLEHLTERGSPLLRDQAVWTLGNIIGDNVKYRDMLVDAGIVEQLVAQVTPETVALEVESFGRDTMLNLAWILKVTASSWNTEELDRLDLM